MSLSALVTEHHVEQSIRLFKLSTVEAAKSTMARENLSEAERERVKAAESVILGHLPINGRASKSSILRELTRRGFSSICTGRQLIVAKFYYFTNLSGRALKTLIQRGLLEEKNDSTLRRLAGGI